MDYTARLEWTSVADKLPPEVEPDRFFGAFSYSPPVLGTDGKRYFVCYYVRYPYEENSPHWTLAGRDGDPFKGVTHWMFLPRLPAPAKG